LINDTQKRRNSGDIIRFNSHLKEVRVKKNSETAIKKKLNAPGLISFLLFFLVFPLLLVPWHKLFVLRSNTITPIVIHVIGSFVIGVLMLALGIVALVFARKRKNTLKGNWMGIVGIVLGVVLAGFGGFIIMDYLIRGAV
jgi:hypothetical protein